MFNILFFRTHSLVFPKFDEYHHSPSIIRHLVHIDQQIKENLEKFHIHEIKCKKFDTRFKGQYADSEIYCD